MNSIRNPTFPDLAGRPHPILKSGEPIRELVSLLMKNVPDSAVYVIPNPQGPSPDHQGPGVPELELIARWMDSVFQIPGVGVRFGLDSLLGLIPGLGDAATSLVSLYILQAAQRRGVSRLTMTRMAFNIIADFAVGSIPLVGDVFDVYWKANQWNVELLRQHVADNPTEKRHLRRSDWLFFAGMIVLVILSLVGSMTIAYLLLTWLGSIMVNGRV